MQSRQLNLRHLRAFALVCQHQGITAAAETVHMSQPAITQAIAKLESGLEERLLIRSSLGMYPTEAGSLFATRCARAMSILEKGGAAAMRKAKPARKGSFDTLVTSTQLRALIAIATHGSFSIAARSQGISQPSLYRTARDFEKVTGLTLYRKTEVGYDVTAAAQLLVQAAKLMFYELDQGIAEVMSLHGKDHGRMVIGSLPLPRSALLPRAINTLAEAFPDLEIQVIDGPYDDLLSGLRQGDIDVVLGALRDPAPSEDVLQIPLLQDHLGIHCHPSHPLVETGQIPLATLTSYPWVLPRIGTPTRDNTTAFFRRHGMSEPSRIIETSSLVLMRGLLKAAERLTMVSDAQVEEEVNYGALVRLPITIGDKPRSIGVTHRQDWHPTPAQNGFLKILSNFADPPGAG